MRTAANLLVALFLVSTFAGCLGAKTLQTGGNYGAVPLVASAQPKPHVVIATFDTGTNPFHPCFRRPGFTGPAGIVPDFPAGTPALNLTFAESYKSAVAASNASLKAIQPHTLYYIPDTSLLFYGSDQPNDELVDYYPHGSQASSQIVCPEYGLAPDAWLVILNWYKHHEAAPELIKWAADQPWIDVIHLNIQDAPMPVKQLTDGAIAYALKKGKFLVIAGGNGVAGNGANYPMELSQWNGPPGSLIAGACDNGGYTTFSNLDPHAVMDGLGTRAAEPRGFGTTSFGGTSSASPRTTGYVAELLLQIRQRLNYTGHNQDGNLITLAPDAAKPAKGPLSDGILTVPELHQVIRETADPNPHASKWDGNGSAQSIPQPIDLPVAFYPKMGYGKLSEFTMPNAVAVALGEKDMPVRPVEDRLFAASEAIRANYWGG